MLEKKPHNLLLSDLITRSDGAPLYRQLADGLARQIEKREMQPGDRLPTQREVARSLSLNLTTVTRAFALLQERGLIESRVGRGTSIAQQMRAVEPAQADFRSSPSDDSGLIDLSVNRPATSGYLEALAPVLARLPRDQRFRSLEDYHPPAGPLWAREAAANWLAPMVACNDPGRVLISEGAQHGLACALRALTGPGDLVLADKVTYQGIHALCRSLKLELRGIEMDEAGMCPQALRRACRETKPRALFLVPDLHNPTTITLPAVRRAEIVEIAAHYGLLILEDAVYSPMLEERPASFAALAPDRTLYLSGLSKCIAPGIRVGFLAAPPSLVDEVASAIRLDLWSTAPLTALATTVLLEEGSADHLIRRNRQELARRQKLVQEVLGFCGVRTQSASSHAWLPLPDPWRSNEFVQEALKQGVAVLSGDAFAVGRESALHAVRIHVGAARSLEDLRTALGVLADLASKGHQYVYRTI